MPQFGAYLTIVIYDRKTFIVQATGAKVIILLNHGNLLTFHGKTVILCYKTRHPWKLVLNGSQLPIDIILKVDLLM